MKKTAPSRHGAFTLVEMLVVIAIIGILAAILFPAFKGAQERARQTNCASNLNQIHIAVNQYLQDTRRYPDSLVDLLPESTTIDDGTAIPPAAPVEIKIVKGTGYLRGGLDSLRCQNDDLDVTHSSYGSLSKKVDVATPATLTAMPGRYVFNYWGYRPNGFTLENPAQVAMVAGVATGTTYPLLSNTARAYDAANPLSNPVKYSLSNRFAPPSTIITHCVYHRPNTANDLALPTDLYATPAIGDGTGARDIVLRVDGTVKVTDVSAPVWNTVTPAAAPAPAIQPLWQIQ